MILREWFDLVIRNSLPLTIYLGFIAAAGWMWSQKNPLLLYYIWMLGLIKAVLPPIQLFSTRLPAGIVPMDFTLQIPTAEVKAATGGQISWSDWMFYIWIGGLVIGLGISLIREIRFSRYLRRAIRIEPDEQQLELIRYFGIRRSVRIYQLGGLPGALSRGLFRPAVYLPAHSAEEDNTERMCVLAHELAHIRRYDYLQLILQRLVEIVYFFHPMVWIMRRELNLCREKICDTMAIRLMNQPAASYSRYLYHQLETYVANRKDPGFANGFVQSPYSLLRRFNYLLNPKGVAMLTLRKYQWLVIALMVSLGIVLSCDSKTPSEKISAQDESLKKLGLPPEFAHFDTPPEILNQVAPIYPKEAKEAGIQGDVWLRVPIDIEGNVIKDHIVVTKNTAGDSTLVNAALEAAGQYKLSPAKLEGKPVPVWISLPFKFHLKDGPKFEPPDDTEGLRIETIHIAEPKYPEIARRAGIEGTVILKIQIQADGTVDPETIEVLHNTTGESGCVEAAIEAAKNSKYKVVDPTGKHTPIITSLPFRFKLENKPKS